MCRKANRNGLPLNYAAGKGDLAIVKLLVETAGADVFQVGRDNRTPYKIAIAAGHAAVARYLAEAEEAAGGDTDRTSSRQGEARPYCKAFPLRDMRQFEEWSEGKTNWTDASGGEDADRDANVPELSDDAIVFLHHDLTVTQSMFRDEDVIMNQVTPQWKAFCADVLGFSVPDDFDLMPSTVTTESGQESSVH